MMSQGWKMKDIDLRLIGPLGCGFLTGSVIVTVFLV